MRARKRLLINWVYYQPIGHAIEAFRYAQEWRNANPDLEIAVALNRRSAVDLAACIPAIDTVYPIDVEEFAGGAAAYPSLERVPREWDYLFTDPRHEAPMGSDALDRCAQAFRTHIQAGLSNTGWSVPEGFPGTQRAPLALCLPASARQAADQFIRPGAATRICLVFGSGTEASRTPPMPFWRTLIRQLLAEFADLEIILLGALDPGRSITQGVTHAAIEELLAEFPQVKDGFDRGLINQLAIVERCQLFISPHTGLGFATQCVGVPWLVLSGGWASESWLNGVPIISVYPDCPRYPCDFWSPNPARPMLAECRQHRAAGAQFACLTEAALTEKLPQIIAAARALVRGELPYEVCAQRHYEAMIPRLGLRPGDPFIEGWPDSLSAEYRFKRG
jgi:ADP-heptose:LPS heptosyltransferase